MSVPKLSFFILLFLIIFVSHSYSTSRLDSYTNLERKSPETIVQSYYAILPSFKSAKFKKSYHIHTKVPTGPNPRHNIVPSPP